MFLIVKACIQCFPWRECQKGGVARKEKKFLRFDMVFIYDPKIYGSIFYAFLGECFSRFDQGFKLQMSVLL